MATKYTGKELQIKKDIDRVNRQIRQAAKTFGTESKLYLQYVRLIAPSGVIGLGKDMVRETKGGVIQLSISKKAIKEYTTYSAYEKKLQRLGKQPTVAETKKQYIEAYRQRMGIEKPIKGRQEQQRAVEIEIQQENFLFDEIGEMLYEYYKLEEKEGGRFVSHDEIKKMSKGQKSSIEELTAMRDKLREELETEQHEIVTNVLHRW